ncbi:MULTISPECIES: FliM/FliN family flagellar motor switch protein [unclassified Mesorhizobium]|uniref:FliM/FliN family flagellar motor switch protein n=1 Tax=unclassified Mesorhizobium TaxID=325217 RepID=UPI00112700A5|nr:MULTISPECIES: FliM/FliN family flagellar motor switch protein [unclassified Mesorhizobium]TPJ47391.1 flagellar motor switch protein FliM [Mesorhizobium sp. B2-6-6]MBZ9999802.1 FliM/FliN family flagellar motor switch protein [Mesorhizobium sp. B264B2A]MCA0005596.1 FliM/FliN family flagellar motor switch protein [Mesorhizobium sp. B264B1B]MCA0021236.1 FliM/FliN family flagellar motor switch protein [Mesorhizobium sp. B264B1A]MCA0055891.1 FliM/FliN family flagellar motor switch protein [Mesorh
MTSPGSPSQARSLIIERLVGDSGEAAQVIGAGRGMAERAAPLLQKSLTSELGVPVTVDLRGVEVSRVAEARSRAGDTFAMTIVASATSSDAMTLVIDAPAIAVTLCTLFGGDPEMPASPIERDLSQIEVDVSTMMFQQVAQALNGSGRRSLDLRLPVPRAMSGTEAKRHVLRDGAAIRIVFGISTPADSGTVTVTMPQRVVLASRDSAAAGGENDQGASWRARFSEEVMRSTVALEATMPLARLTLGDLADFEIGQIIEFEETAQSQARLGARGKTLFVCEFGKLGQNYTVRIKHPYDAGQDFIDGLMPAGAGHA